MTCLLVLISPVPYGVTVKIDCKSREHSRYILSQNGWMLSLTDPDLGKLLSFSTYLKVI